MNFSRRWNFVSIIAGAAGLASCSPSPSPATTRTSPTAAASESITPARIQEHIAVLASDAMGGRGTPSAGLEEAAAYLAAQHRSFGLEPAGDSETYYQRYPFRGRRPDPSSASDPVFPANVVAILPGSDPLLRNEYVVLSAHYDHCGMGTVALTCGLGGVQSGDTIFNGADDNASGTSALLEVARALSSMPEAPRRSVLFLHVSGEEHGLLGSRWFSDNPTVPVGGIIANINVDMIGRNAPDTIVAIGKGYSSLGRVVNRVGENHPELGLTVADDLWPQERFFYRSDHFNFARLEIPAIFFFAGTHEDYHRPSDHAEKIDADKAARVTRLIFHTVQEIANASEPPEWDAAGLAEVRRLTR